MTVTILNLHVLDHQIYSINQSKFDVLLLKTVVVVVTDPNHHCFKTAFSVALLHSAQGPSKKIFFLKTGQE